MVMNPEISPSTKPAGSKPRRVFVQYALPFILAAALVALAVYFSSGQRPGTSTVLPTPTTLAVIASPTPFPTVDPRPVDAAKDHIRGAANAKVTIIEYVDLECPYCKQFHPTLQQIMKDYPQDVRWVFRHAPLINLHRKAPAEANAAECAGEQGKFWEFVDGVFAVTPSNDGLDASQLPVIAKKAGVKNIPQFQKCMDDGKYNALIQAEFNDAVKAGALGTPYSILMNDQGEKAYLKGAYPLNAVRAYIDTLL